MDSPQPEKIIDLSGLKCPLPVLRTKKALAELEKGQVLRIIATDPGAYADIQSFAQMAGCAVLAAERTANGSVVLLQR